MPARVRVGACAAGPTRTAERQLRDRLADFKLKLKSGGGPGHPTSSSSSTATVASTVTTVITWSRDHGVT